MSHYYNENDKFAAKWLENLILCGLIPHGVVDMRSIADVKAEDLQNFTQCHFFAGIGGWPLAFRIAGWPDDLFGLALAPASHSLRRGSKKVLPTTGIYGRSFETLSPSENLQLFLESKLRQRLSGSDLCEVIWKPWATPWGQSLSKPRARVRTTFETAIGLWQTMVRDDAMDRVCGKVNSRGEPKLSAQAIWATPRANEGTGSKVPPGRTGGMALKTQVLTTWPTTTTRDHKDGHYCPNVPVNGLLGRMGWPTPMANDATGSTHCYSGKNPDGSHKIALKPPGAAKLSNGSSEQTEKRGALNPEFVCWLMGYPLEWVNCAG